LVIQAERAKQELGDKAKERLMQHSTVPLYLDWSFWAVFVAGVAVVLSQLPPIHQLLRPAKLAMELYSRVQVTQKIGNPNVGVHVILINTGGRSIRIKGFTLKLWRDGRDLAFLPAQYYLQTPNDKSTVVLTSFSLKPTEEWAHFVTFLNYFSLTDEKKYKAAELALKNDINAKRKLPENKDRIVEADSHNVRPFNEMFEEKFIWDPGEYEFEISVELPGNKTGVTQKHRFTLFESHSSELSAAREDFKIGDGVYYYSGNHTGVWVQIIEA